MSTESNFSLTVKVSNELYTVRGDDWNTFSKNLDDALLGIQRVVDYVNAAHAVDQLALPQPPAQQPPAQQGPPEWAQPAPQQNNGWPQGPAPVTTSGPPAPTCVHGARVFKTGGGGNTGKREWKAWMCPTPKGTPGQCDPEWVK